MSKTTYDSALVIGMGLIGSSIARALKEKQLSKKIFAIDKDSEVISCLLYTSPSPRDRTRSRMPSSA